MVVDTDKLSDETVWQAVCLVIRLASTHPKGQATIMDCRRVAIELLERMNKEGGEEHAR